MKASSGRFLYELTFWIVAGGLVYLNRGLYKSVENQLEPILQAYTGVTMFVICAALFFFILYLREAIANTFVYLYEHASGGKALNYEKGNSSRQIAKTARRLARKRDFEGAGEAYEALELWHDAAIVYERGNLFGRAAASWKQAGNTGKAIELYEKDGNYEAAGELCMSEGLRDRATRNFRIAGQKCLEANQFLAAAEFYEKAGEYAQAGNIFETAHKPERALACYEKSGNVDKMLEILRNVHPSDYHRKGPEFTRVVQRSAEALASAGHGPEAAKIIEECHDLNRAAEIYASNKMFDKSAELFLKAGRLDMAGAMARNIEDKNVAADITARLASGNSDWQTAGENYESAGKQNQAIDAYKKARNFEAAARIYESMGRFIMAGEMYSSGKNLVAAANAYAKAYDWRNAAECFEQSGDLAQAIEAYANASNFLKAGTIALKLTDYGRAIEYLQRIPSGSPDFQGATGFLATAFYYQGHYDMATELFARVMDGFPMNRETLPVYYAYARNIENDNPKLSLSTFRQIMGIDVHYSDVADRARRLEQIVTSISGFGNNTPIAKTNTPAIMQSAPLRSTATPFPQQSYTPVSNMPTNMNTDVPGNSPSITISRHKTEHTSAGGVALIEGRYQLQDIVNQCGRITDYKATDTATNRPVYIRTFPEPESSDVRASTMALLSKASRLSHPNINPILTYGDSAGLVYAISDFVEGQDLRQWVRSKGPLSVAELKQFAGQLLQALDVAHSQDVYHLNLRPEIITVAGDSSQKVVLSGFGVPTRQQSADESIYATMPDSDPQYLAPEQIVGGEPDSRTDIYALGLLFFFVLTGRTPFEVKRINDTQEIARMQVQVSLARPSTIRATLPGAVDEIFLKCVHKSPAARYANVAELIADIQNLSNSTIS